MTGDRIDGVERNAYDHLDYESKDTVFGGGIAGMAARTST